MSYAVYKDVVPPSAVESCAWARLLAGSPRSQLVVGRCNVLDVFEVDGAAGGELEDAPFAALVHAGRLRLACSTTLAGNVASVHAVRLDGSAARAVCGSESVEVLLVTAADAKASVLGLDPFTMTLKLLAMFNFEEGATGLGSAVRVPRLHVVQRGLSGRAIAAVDPLSRVALMPVFDSKLVVVPFQRDVEGLGEAEPDLAWQYSSSPDAGGGGGGDMDAVGAAAADALAHRVVRQPYIIDLAEIGAGGSLAGAGVLGVAFLEGYRLEPAVAFLLEMGRTCASRLGSLASTSSVVATTLDVTQRRTPVLWQRDGLPADAYALAAVPDPVSGVLLLSPNAVMYLNQYAYAGLALNALAAVTVDAGGAYPLSPYGEGAALVLDAARCVFLSPTCALLSERGGAMFLLKLHVRAGGGGASDVDALTLHATQIRSVQACAMAVLLGPVMETMAQQQQQGAAAGAAASSSLLLRPAEAEASAPAQTKQHTAAGASATAVQRVRVGLLFQASRLGDSLLSLIAFTSAMGGEAHGDGSSATSQAGLARALEMEDELMYGSSSGMQIAEEDPLAPPHDAATAVSSATSLNASGAVGSSDGSAGAATVFDIDEEDALLYGSSSSSGGGDSTNINSSSSLDPVPDGGIGVSQAADGGGAGALTGDDGDESSGADAAAAPEAAAAAAAEAHPSAPSLPSFSLHPLDNLPGLGPIAEATIGRSGRVLNADGDGPPQAAPPTELVAACGGDGHGASLAVLKRGFAPETATELRLHGCVEAWFLPYSFEDEGAGSSGSTSAGGEGGEGLTDAGIAPAADGDVGDHPVDAADGKSSAEADADAPGADDSANITTDDDGAATAAEARAAPPTAVRRSAAFVLLSMSDGSTRVLAIGGGEQGDDVEDDSGALREVPPDATELLTSAATLAAGTILQAGTPVPNTPGAEAPPEMNDEHSSAAVCSGRFGRLVQVHSEGVRVLSSVPSAPSTQEIMKGLPMDVGGLEVSDGVDIVAASFADPFVLIRLSDGGLRLLSGDEADGEVAVSSVAPVEAAAAAGAAAALGAAAGDADASAGTAAAAAASTDDEQLVAQCQLVVSACAVTACSLVRDEEDGSLSAALGLQPQPEQRRRAVFAVLALRSGSLEMYSVPSWTRVYQARGLPVGPSILRNRCSGGDAWGGAGANRDGAAHPAPGTRDDNNAAADGAAPLIAPSFASFQRGSGDYLPADLDDFAFGRADSDALEGAVSGSGGSAAAPGAMAIDEEAAAAAAAYADSSAGDLAAAHAGLSSSSASHSLLLDLETEPCEDVADDGDEDEGGDHAPRSGGRGSASTASGADAGRSGGRPRTDAEVVGAFAAEYTGDGSSSGRGRRRRLPHTIVREVALAPLATGGATLVALTSSDDMYVYTLVAGMRPPLPSTPATSFAHDEASYYYGGDVNSGGNTAAVSGTAAAASAAFLDAGLPLQYHRASAARFIRVPHASSVVTRLPDVTSAAAVAAAAAAAAAVVASSAEDGSASTAPHSPPPPPPPSSAWRQFSPRRLVPFANIGGWTGVAALTPTPTLVLGFRGTVAAVPLLVGDATGAAGAAALPGDTLFMPHIVGVFAPFSSPAVPNGCLLASQGFLQFATFAPPTWPTAPAAGAAAAVFAAAAGVGGAADPVTAAAGAAAAAVVAHAAPAGDADAASSDDAGGYAAKPSELQEAPPASESDGSTAAAAAATGPGGLSAIHISSHSSSGGRGVMLSVPPPRRAPPGSVWRSSSSNNDASSGGAPQQLHMPHPGNPALAARIAGGARTSSSDSSKVDASASSSSGGGECVSLWLDGVPSEGGNRATVTITDSSSASTAAAAGPDYDTSSPSALDITLPGAPGCVPLARVYLGAAGARARAHAGQGEAPGTVVPRSLSFCELSSSEAGARALSAWHAAARSAAAEEGSSAPLPPTPSQLALALLPLYAVACYVPILRDHEADIAALKAMAEEGGGEYSQVDYGEHVEMGSIEGLSSTGAGGAAGAIAAFAALTSAGLGAPPAFDPAYEIRLYSGASGGAGGLSPWSLLGSYSLRPHERAMCTREMLLGDGTPANRAAPHLLVGTASVGPRGEEAVPGGRVLVFRVSSTALTLAWEGDFRGPVCALAPLSAKSKELGETHHVVIGWGRQAQVCEWHRKPGEGGGGGNELRTICRYDTGGLWIRDVAVAAGYVLIADVTASLRFMKWREEDHSLLALAVDGEGALSGAAAADMLIHDKTLGLLGVNGSGSLAILQYSPKDAGTRLVRAADFRLPAPAESLLRTRFALPVGTHAAARRRTAVMCPLLDGRVGTITPLEEGAFRRLLGVQRVLQRALPHAGGLNPAAWRLYTPPVPCAAEAPRSRNVLDGVLLWRFVGLDARMQARVAGAAGTTVDAVLDGLRSVELTTMAF